MFWVFVALSLITFFIWCAVKQKPPEVYEVSDTELSIYVRGVRCAFCGEVKSSGAVVCRYCFSKMRQGFWGGASREYLLEKVIEHLEKIKPQVVGQ